MWPYDDEEDEGWDEFDLDEDEDYEDVIARVEAAYRSERARIRTSSDVSALREMQAVYVDQLAEGELTGVAGMRARDLIEQIEERVAALDAARRARADRAEIARREAERRAERETLRRTRAREEAARRQRDEAQQQARERARRVAEEERAAAAWLANAKAAEVEARVAMLRARAARAARATAPAVASRPARRQPKPERRSELERAVTAPVAEGTAETPIEAADRAALMSVGRWPPPLEPLPGSLFWSPDAHWPKDWDLTGFDLAMFRGRLNVTQRVLAGQLGVDTVEVARAEANPKQKVRPALQVALDGLIADFRREQERSCAAAQAGDVSGTPSAPLTGGELARFRSERGLSQRQAAEILGVAHGTVAKAELAPEKALGEQLDRALRAEIRR
ncbi:MAG: hypothetical protein H6738_20300 [Alphaproteobacteria bacterium]|nr:hypothetical protein [Myxococcales bacterium]MCB9699135.1 hypothetical protein [Alphaproteobacteria bacterium]